MRVETTETICDLAHSSEREVAAVDHLVVEIDGSIYTLDLCRQHGKDARVALKPFLGQATAQAPAKRAGRKSAPRATGAQKTAPRKSAAKKAAAKKVAPRKSVAAKSTAKKATTRATSSKAKSGSATDPAQVRAWAQEQGIDVSARGRISADVQEQFAKRKRGRRS